MQTANMLKYFWQKNAISARNLQRASSRHLSALSVHSTFPATLVRVNWGRGSHLFNIKDHADNDIRPYDDGVVVDDKGYVSGETPEGSQSSNGALFMPNTFMMQEIIRREMDDYYDRQDQGQKDLECPRLFTIRKGTQVPSSLMLVREYLSRFTLRPSHPIPLTEDLNRILSTFYTQVAQECPAEEWLEKHEFQSAVEDEAEAEWMSK